MMYYDRLWTKRVSLPEALSDGPVFVPCVCDCFTAEIAENAGYRAVCLMGEDAAAYFTGLPDLGLLTPTEFRILEGQISKVTNVPMIIDMKNGFGNEVNAIRAAVDLVEAGARAVIMNDRVFPDRYGNENGSTCLGREEFYNKCRAVADTLRGSDAVLIAEVDCLKELGMEEAEVRCALAVKAGAYGTLVKRVTERWEAEKIGRDVPGIKVFEMSRDRRIRPADFEDLVSMGYSIVICPTFTDAAYCAYDRQLKEAFRVKNDFFVDPVDLINGVERREFLGLNAWLEKGREYNSEIITAAKTRALD